MSQKKEKKIPPEKSTQTREDPAKNKPTYVIKGLFKDTDFIIKYARKMARGG